MKQRNYFILGAIFLIFTILQCTQSMKNKRPQQITIKILETTDVHGAIFPFNFINNEATNSSLAQVLTYIKKVRADSTCETVLLDNGDFLQGQPIVYYYNFEKTTSPHICSQVMNFMKYDAATVGNHDIEAGHEVYDRLTNEFNFPWLAANAVKTTDGTPYFVPYTIINRKGIKIAVLGLITPAIPNWLPKDIWEGMEFDDMIESAEKWVKMIQEKEKPDILVGLLHSGIDYTFNNQTAETYKNENASQLVAEKVAGFDVIFAGHDHADFNFTVKNPHGKDVLILNPNSYAKFIGEATIEMTWNEKTEKYDKKISGKLIETALLEADKEFLQKFDAQFDEVKEYVERRIGYLSQSLTSKEALFGESKFIDLIHQLQLHLSDAQISFSAPLSFDMEIQAGELKVRDMFKLYRYENLLYTMKLSGAEIKNYLEFSYGQWFNQMKDENDHLLKFRYDETGEIEKNKHGNPRLAEAFFNFSSAAGINYTVDVSKPMGERITITGLTNGDDFDMEKGYLVAVNSYRGNGGGGHFTEGAGLSKEELANRVVKSTTKDLRFYIMRWIEKQDTVQVEMKHNWKITPETWWKKGKKRDFDLIF